MNQVGRKDSMVFRPIDSMPRFFKAGRASRNAT